MTKEQLEFRAEYRDGKLVEVKDEVREGDYVEWHTGAWTSVAKGSSLIGQLSGTLKFLRIVPRET